MLQEIVALALGFAFAYPPNSCAAELSVSGSAFISYDWAANFVPRWSGGGLLSVEGESSSSPVVRAFGSDGFQIAALPVIIPNATLVVIYAASRGVTGLIAATGAFKGSQGRHGAFVAIFPPDGGSEKIVMTNPYVPDLIAVAADGTFWTSGRTSGNQNAATAGVLWHFDQNGRKLGSAVHQKDISSQRNIADPGNQMAASSTRIAWLCPKEGRYMEISVAGAEITNIPVSFRNGEEVVGFALTEEGQAFVQTQFAPPAQLTLYSFDTHSGLLSKTTPPRPMGLVGSNGNTIVGLAGNTLMYLTAGQ